MKAIYPALATLKIYILLAAILMMPACARAGWENAPSTIKVGLVAPFEGLHRPLGYEALFGVKLALRERNAAGGINGSRVELVALNDFDDPLEAQTQARTLIADPDVLGVVGHLSLDTTLAALPVYREANLAVSAPWPLPIDSAANWPGLVNVAASADETVVRLDTFARERGLNTITVTNTQVLALPAEVKAVQVAADGVMAGEILLALRRAGVSLPVLGQVDAGSPQVVQVAGEAANGLIYVSPGPNPADVAGSEGFVKAYQSLAGFAPGPRAVLAYEATQVLLGAIELAMVHKDQPGRADISAVITTVQRRGLSGEIAFNAQGERLNAPVWVYQISGEEYPGVLMAP